MRQVEVVSLFHPTKAHDQIEWANAAQCHYHFRWISERETGESRIEQFEVLERSNLLKWCGGPKKRGRLSLSMRA